MPADRVGALKHVSDRVRVDAAFLAEVALARRSPDGNKLADDGGGAPGLRFPLRFVFAGGRIKLPPRKFGWGRLLAGERSDRFRESLADGVSHESEHVAAPAAAAAVPDLFSSVDAEPVRAAAGRARTTIFFRPDALENNETLRRLEDVRLARTVDELGGDAHRRASNRSP
jgi:hypothetical protein